MVTAPRIFAAAALSLCLSLPICASARPFKFQYVLSCGDYLAQPVLAYQRQYAVSFVRGYMSAYNVYNQRHQIMQDIEISSLDAYIEKFCREHPLEDSGAAALALMKELGATPPPND
ncbi:hypothetical protein QN413_20805 [Variovorax sp. LG9.2]|nr:hypothetical protein [Variovorax sp. LG9.2]